MKKIIVIAIALLLAIGLSSTFAAESGESNASEKAYEQATDEAIFHRVGDWLTTRGKSVEEKEAMLKERRAKRALPQEHIELNSGREIIEKVKEKTKEYIVVEHLDGGIEEAISQNEIKQI